MKTEKITGMTAEDARKRYLSPASLKKLRQLATRPDSEIDYSDNPEITREDIVSGRLVPKHGGARPGAGRKPAESKKRITTLSVDCFTAKIIRDKAEQAGVTISEFLRCRVA